MTASSPRPRFRPDSLALFVLDVLAVLFFLCTLVMTVVLFVGTPNTIPEKLLGAALLLLPGIAAWLFHGVLQDARYSDPFVRQNVLRLNRMVWLLLVPWLIQPGLDILSRLLDGKLLPTKYTFDGIHADGLLLSLFVFGLAGVFARGVALREEQELTV